MGSATLINILSLFSGLENLCLFLVFNNDEHCYLKLVFLLILVFVSCVYEETATAQI